MKTYDDLTDKEKEIFDVAVDAVGIVINTIENIKNVGKIIYDKGTVDITIKTANTTFSVTVFAISNFKKFLLEIK